ncbi:MAG: HAMP domain-containing histidine kinase, partial [Verrucomicrobia bacterium]|nr:HAMP domain-containing histidine kinase [Verrucomicrobiota bacterium]
VADTGPGVADQIRGRIFEAFTSYGKQGGTGLGMAIARSTVEAHGGRIWLESEKGKGATFFVLVPKRVPLES